MNNLNTRNPDTDDIQNLPEDKPEFNYSTYTTAEEQISENSLVPQGSNQGYAYLSSAEGGSVSQLSFKDNTKKQSRSTKSGGTRGKIRGFSRVSRRNFLRLFASINRPAFSPPQEAGQTETQILWALA